MTSKQTKEGTQQLTEHSVCSRCREGLTHASTQAAAARSVQICRTGDVRQAAASLTATTAAAAGITAAEAGPRSPLHLSTSVKGLGRHVLSCCRQTCRTWTSFA